MEKIRKFSQEHFSTVFYQLVISSHKDLKTMFYQLITQLNSASDLLLLTSYNVSHLGQGEEVHLVPGVMGHVKADYLPHHGYLAILQHAQHPGADTQGYINMILTGIAVANCLVMLEEVLI